MTTGSPDDDCCNKYAPGAIEARGYKGGRQVMTSKRETTGPAARLVIRSDRVEMPADGENVVLFAVEVQDAQGRVVPVADNNVSFKVTGPARIAGVGNGDPTSHEPDTASSRKAFSGLCMALAQATKSAGSVIVEATSPGLASATATVTSKAVRLRPQVAVWEREVPSGGGITGLWRPRAAAGGAGLADPMSVQVGGGDLVFTLRQSGATVTGAVEATGGVGFFGSPGGALEAGRIEGDNISFKAGNMTYAGTVSEDRIELKRTMAPFRLPGAADSQPAGTRAAVGPPPDGTDPSFGSAVGRRGMAATPLVLHRVTR